MAPGLRQIFVDHRGGDCFKWEHYFDIYDRHCAGFRGRAPKVLEVGVMRGGSLQIWKRYFGPGANIHGVDINPRCERHVEEDIAVHIGNQGDGVFLRNLGRDFGPFDVVIDDGSHRMEDQKVSLDTLWHFVRDGGVYFCEDTHTSYFHRFGGGYRRPESFIERAKGLVDCLHMWWSGRMSAAEAAAWTPHLASAHFYPGCLVLEKRRQTPPNAIWNKGGVVRREPAKTLHYSREQDPEG